MAMLTERSARYVAAVRARAVLRIDAAPARRRLPAAWQFNLHAHPYEHQGRSFVKP
jgi:hypothetical protein